MSDLLNSSISREDIAALAGSEGLVLDDEDRIAVLLSTNSIDVQACPGSGKTTLIAAKLMLLAKQWRAQERGVCVLSHTNVAKDEIIDRLNKSKTIEASRLLSSPHFIGTIQEFVNRFLALPYLRSIGISDVTVDNDEYVAVARRLLGQDQFAWLCGTLNGLGTLDSQDAFLRATYRICTQHETEVNISKRPNVWQRSQNIQRAQRDLLRLKSYLDNQGVFLFRDMYTHAQILASSNVSLRRSLAMRFPYLFIDEMQDTQKFQDELLRELFPLEDPKLIVQRFGDPDQAIFHGIGNEEPNRSFNGKSADDMDFVIHKSHRFDKQISEKIKRFSFNEVPLESELDEAALIKRRPLCASGETFEHTVLAFDDNTRRDVIAEFARLVSAQFETRYKQSQGFCAKVVGAVGNEIDPNADQLKIGHYWANYDKEKKASSFKPNSLIEAVRYCRRNPSVDWAENYKILMGCILRLLRLAGKVDGKGRNFSTRSLRVHLESEEKWKNLREGIYIMLNTSYAIDQECWGDIVRLLSTLLEFQQLSEEAREYIAFTEDDNLAEVTPEIITQSDEALIAMPGNVIRHEDGFSIELSTIHGVKGETHDATLVIETKNHCFDMGAMVPYLTGEWPCAVNPNSRLSETARSRRANRQFMRQFYVAMSRPRHLLCLALHSARLSSDHEMLLQDNGWKVLRIPDRRDRG